MYLLARVYFLMRFQHESAGNIDRGALNDGSITWPYFDEPYRARWLLGRAMSKDSLSSESLLLGITPCDENGSTVNIPLEFADCYEQEGQE
jgi:hypothetical protein